MGPLTECGHCIRNYLLLVPVLPGIVAAMLAQGAGGIVLGALATLLELLLLVAWMRRGGLAAWSAACAVAVLNGVLAVFLSYGLRM